MRYLVAVISIILLLILEVNMIIVSAKTVEASLSLKETARVVNIWRYKAINIDKNSFNYRRFMNNKNYDNNFPKKQKKSIDTNTSISEDDQEQKRSTPSGANPLHN